MTRAESERAVNAFIDAIRSGVVGGEKVTLQDFAVFDRTIKQSGSSRDPRTGEKLVPQKRAYPSFRPGKDLKQVVNATTSIGN